MTLYRSTLLLLTCVTFLGVIPEPARSSTGVRSGAATPETRKSPLAGGSFHMAQAAPTETAPNTPSSPSNSPATTLRPGAQGAQVQQLQSTLRLLGYYDGSVDGNYGQSTEVAVLNFQKAIGLSADGVAGPSTLSRLQELQKAKTETPKPPAETATDSAPTKAERRWLGWLFGVIAIATIGTGILYLLNRMSSSSQKPRSLPESESESARTGFSGAAVSASERSDHFNGDTPESVAEVSSNGHKASVVAINGTQQPHQPSQVTNPQELTVRETTRLPKINIVEELVKDLRSPDPTKRRKAIWELGQRGDTQAVQPLVDLMIDSDSKQRSLILASLSEIGVRTLKPMNRALAISLQDENPEVRKNAIRDVTRIYDLVGQISQLLHHATQDPDAEVQETARWALTQVNRIRTIANAEGVPALKNTVSPPESLPENRSEL